jgi:hypothetical protein
VIDTVLHRLVQPEKLESAQAEACGSLQDLPRKDVVVV